MKRTIWSLLLSLTLLQGCSSIRADSTEAAPPTPNAEAALSETSVEAHQGSETAVTETIPQHQADITEVGVVGKDVPYVPTPYEAVESMLDLAQVGSDDVLYDLGSGDGRIVIAAAQRGAKAVGVELDTALVLQSRKNAEAKDVSELTEFYQQDLFETDFSEATVVTMYLLPSINAELRPRLLSQLKPGSRIVSYSFDMDGWEPDHKEVVGVRPIYLWTVPTKASD